MKRIYHSHDKWEEVEYGMYNNHNPKDLSFLVEKVLHFFSNKNLVRDNMSFVIDNFKNSCEHNLTNPSMNKVAWLGQSAVSFWGRIPEDVTRLAWNYLNKEKQDRANKIAEEEIKRWENERCQRTI